MAKILDFRSKGGSCSPSDFLTDGNETLSFDTRQGGMFRLGGLSRTSPFPDPKKDWSNQELADLYRVHRLLSGANVPVETDRGITDEGDPWFVFCHASGEVFIHLCRIDGIYLLDSPNVLRPLRGADFRALIADFSNQSLPAQSAADETAQRVIRLERGGKIRLHPSAMLAALIWTLFLASEDLVLMAPAAQAAGTDDASDDGLLNFDGLFTVSTTDPLIEAAAFEADQAQHVLQTRDAGPDLMPLHADMPMHMREMGTSQQGLTAHQNGFTIGLSSIAIAMGFMSEVLLLDDQRKVLDSLNKLGFLEYGQDADAGTAAGIVDDADGTDLMVMLQKFLGIDLAFETDVAEADTPEAKQSPLQQELKHLDGDALKTSDMLPASKSAALAELKNKNVDIDVPAAASGKAIKSSDDAVLAKAAEAPVSEGANDSKILNIFEVVRVFQESDLEEIRLGQSTVKISFELSGSNDFAFLDQGGAGQDISTGITLSQFEEISQRLMDFFKTKGNDMSFIEQENRFIAVDRDALRDGDVDYVEWQTDDGKIISLIGHQSDFMHFDMIA